MLRNMDACIAADASGKELPDASVALVVTSPPYFAGKDYELAIGKRRYSSQLRRLQKNAQGLYSNSVFRSWNQVVVSQSM